MLLPRLNAPVRVMTYNAHLFGVTGQFQVPSRFGPGYTREETGFYYNDHRRLPHIIQSLRNHPADFVGLTEIWDPEMRDRIRDELKDLYPHSVISPAAPGIGGILDQAHRRLPTMAGNLLRGMNDVVDRFNRNHYIAGEREAAKRIISEDMIGRSVKSVSGMFNASAVWGAGLLLLSRHPLVSPKFVHYEEKADWEHMILKGMIYSEAEISPRGQRVQLVLGHYQEGLSDEAVAARGQQIRQTRRLLNQSNAPAIAMGDFNVVADTSEYQWMLGALKLFDASSGDTYEDPNPYKDKQKAPRTGRSFSRRLDYVLGSQPFRAIGSQVLRSAFRHPELDCDLSDHFPVYVELGLNSPQN